MVRPSETPSFIELFTPKLVTVLREGYALRDLRADAIAALTVAIVALPLSMAIAIACGVTPDRGLYTSIAGGFVVSALGGSRFQVGGPAGAFIVLISATVAAHGIDGLVIATFLSGLIMLGVGFLRLGSFVKYIPYPVTVAFTFGIAIIIFSGEITDLLGLRLAGAEPGPIVPKVVALFAALPTINLAAVAVTVLSIAIMVGVRRLRPHWPSYLIAVGVGACVVWLLHLPVETIGSRFGGIPRAMPMAHLPSFSLAKIVEMLPAAASFALLGSIESLLSAVVADSMTGRRHRSNCELVAQGAANIVSSLFGGMCVTGTIARTATNVRAGARGPISGMLHAVFLLLFILIAAPLASYIPLATLAAVLAIVAWNMAEKHEFSVLFRASRGDALVLVVTLALVVFRDLSEGIIAGFALSALLFLHRMATSVKVEGIGAVIEEDVADFQTGSERVPYDPSIATDPDIVLYRISGAFFFGAASGVAAALDRMGEHPKAYVIDFSAVPMIDSTAAATIKGFVRKAGNRGALLYFAHVSANVLQELSAHGIKPPQIRLLPDSATALASARADIRGKLAENVMATAGNIPAA
jgi:SulP family sulfate permease